LAQHTVPKRAKLGLTFDDGYRNNITYAAPILIRKDSPAVFYLSTGQIVSRAPMWIDRLDFVLQKLELPEIEITLQQQVFKIKLKPHSRFDEDYMYLRRSIKDLYRDDFVMLSDIASEAFRLEKLAGTSLLDSITDDPVAEIVTADEVSGKYDKITFGSHTVSHVRVDRISEQLLLAELRESKTWIEEATQERCLHFCYPNGDFNRRSIAALAESGYKTAVTTIEGSNRVGDSELLALRRISIPQNEKAYEILHSVAISLLKSERVRASN
jgi:peptidoglycan/xylan/chitin deacetylase (PgdA/CDA1 family)